MELIDGKPLTAHIPKSGIPLHDLFDIAIPLADALAAAHARGITHRDVKPDNVMITADGRVKVLDFGLVKLAQDPDSRNDATATVTQEGKILGTVSYMSPEQAEGKPVDARSDVFSLGVLLYQMATGRVPFQGDTPISTITSIMRDQPPSLTDLNRQLPRHLDRVVKRCMAKDPTRRYQSSLELRNELEHLRTEIDSGFHDAPAAAQRGLEMMPLEQDALRGPARVIDLAAVHARLGEAEQAIARLDEVLSFTGAVSIPMLEMDPLWGGIREHPRWRELVNKHG
jgi:serine/threonine protein kinase